MLARNKKLCIELCIKFPTGNLTPDQNRVYDYIQKVWTSKTNNICLCYTLSLGLFILRVG